MKSYSYDLHIHSCLSPCGSEEMTPNNIVNLAKLVECDVIAITDHNTCKNAPAVVKAGEQEGLLVLPGMELCVSEEAHIVCLFEELKAAMEFDEYISANMPHIKNDTAAFGEQIIMDENDKAIGSEESLLLLSSFISASDVAKLVKGYGGISYPAHIDRSSFSLVASLGMVPEDAGFSAVELTYDCDYDEMLKKNPEIADKIVMRSSDSHYLEMLAGDKQRIHLSELSAKALLKKIEQGKLEQ